MRRNRSDWVYMGSGLVLNLSFLCLVGKEIREKGSGGAVSTVAGNKIEQNYYY